MKEIIALMESVRGCQFANLTYVADGGIPKKVINGVVTKLVTTSVQLNYSYESAVNNRLESNGGERIFKALSLPWGQWVDGFENKLIEHKGHLYLRFYNVENAKTKSLWFVDGRLATEDELYKITEYIVGKYEKNSSRRQAEVGLVEHQVSPKVVKVENIVRLAVNGQEYLKANEVNVALATR